jgi:hypothetical protein
VECLGGGRLGSVFRVRKRGGPGDGAGMALKVVASLACDQPQQGVCGTAKEGSARCDSLEAEHRVNQQAARVAPDVVVRACRLERLEVQSDPGSTALKGAGMLMEQVGARITDTGAVNMRAALAALSALHVVRLRDLQRASGYGL